MISWWRRTLWCLIVQLIIDCKYCPTVAVAWAEAVSAAAESGSAAAPPPPLASSMMSYEARLIDHDLQIAIGGGEHGLTTDTGSISNEHLNRILRGVENGHKESIYFFALLKLYGISLPKDVASALQSFRKASELGHAEAATAAGVMYLTGVGVERDYATAIAAFRRGVGLGDTNALWLLGKYVSM